MSIYTTRFTVVGENKFIGKAGQRLALALFVVSTALTASASELSDANARYQAERAVCQRGESNQDRATCLKEAGAALHDAKMGRLSDGDNAYQKNALIRCNALPAEDSSACRRRIAGEGSVSGSVRDGGLLRELVVPDKK
jgi:hypothetical protein